MSKKKYMALATTNVVMINILTWPTIPVVKIDKNNFGNNDYCFEKYIFFFKTC